MIVGTGNVGASIAYALINQRTPVKEIILTDLDTDDAVGEAMDLCDALAVAPSFLKIRAAGYEAARGADLCVITAGANQKPGESRTDLVQKNAAIIRDIVGQVMSNGFRGIFLVVSNPVDTLSLLTWQYSGLPPERVIGSGTVLDSARLRFKIAERLGVNPKSVHAYQIGEHGDSEFTLWSSANIGGERLTDLIPANERNYFETYVCNEAYTIIEKKGATHYGIGACAVQIINCILGDERRVLPVSSYDDNTGTYHGFPTVIGRQGVLHRLDLNLTEAEGIALQKSINILKRTLRAAQVQPPKIRPASPKSAPTNSKLPQNSTTKPSIKP